VKKQKQLTLADLEGTGFDVDKGPSVLFIKPPAAEAPASFEWCARRRCAAWVCMRRGDCMGAAQVQRQRGEGTGGRGGNAGGTPHA
jgi:hypothetical protein